jgi:hypothetical protein
MVLYDLGHRQDGQPSAKKMEADRVAEEVFLEILRRFSLAERFVGERGTKNAPHVFTKQPEAKQSKVSKAELDGAMNRLFDKGKSGSRNIPWQTATLGAGSSR